MKIAKWTDRYGNEYAVHKTAAGAKKVLTESTPRGNTVNVENGYYFNKKGEVIGYRYKPNGRIYKSFEGYKSEMRKQVTPAMRKAGSKTKRRTR
jgi:hypothetical protein